MKGFIASLLIAVIVAIPTAAKGNFYRTTGKRLDEAGDNTKGILELKSRGTNGVSVDIYLKNLPRKDMVLTAWLIWVPGGVTEPEVFEVANHAAPLAATTASFSTGLSGMDPNSLENDGYKAHLSVDLDFNPTWSYQGPLTAETFCYQDHIPGIKKTMLKHYKAQTGQRVPTSSFYLRKYDRHTGFEVLGKDGLPIVPRSPVESLGVEIIDHFDKTTHGISQGAGGTDHGGVMFFPLKERIGKRAELNFNAKKMYDDW